MSDQYPTSPDILSTFSNSTPAIPVQTITASSRQRQGNSKKISKDTVTMLNRLSLENLPLEVIHQIFAFLPLASLTSLRLTSRSILSSATSNSHWRSHFYSLLPQHIALIDVAAIPTSAWSFSLVPDGWFRAYTKLLQIARSNWLLTDEQLKESKWTVSFKAFLREGGARGSSEGSTGYHALVEMRSDLTCHPVQGLPLNSSSWYVDARPSLRFSGYPPNVPSRDPYTWCRIMQHVSVLMVTDAPEFLDALVALNKVMLEEATVGRESVREKQKREFEVVVKEVLERRKSEFDERLKQLHVKRSGGMEMGEDPIGGVGSGGGVVNEENDWSIEDDESDNEGGEWSDDGGYDHSLDRCLLYQQFREQHQLQNSSSSPEASEQSKSSEEAMEDVDSEEP